MNATATVKAAAMEKDYELYCEIKDLDLISKEFKYHSSCYKEFTRGFSVKSRVDNSSASLSPLEPGLSRNLTCDIKAVEEFIEKKVFRDQKAVSMLTLQHIYNKESQPCVKSRHRLKNKLVAIFGNKLIFLTARANTPDVVISSDTVEAQVDVSDKESNIKKVASYLREDIQEYCRSLPALSWPPTVEELSADSRLPPASVTLFLTNLLKCQIMLQVSTLID